jgi:hypothetical protein
MFVNLSWYNPPNTAPEISPSQQSPSTLWDGNLYTVENFSFDPYSPSETETEVLNLLDIDQLSIKSLNVTELLSSDQITARAFQAFEQESIVVKLSESLGETAFLIENSLGETVFSIDSQGLVSGEGIFESEWVPIAPNSETTLYHNLETIPRDFTISKSFYNNGTEATNEGFGQEDGYYYEDLTDISIIIINGSNDSAYFKVFLRK